MDFSVLIFKLAQLNSPTAFVQVVKRPGVIIKPIEFEDPLEKKTGWEEEKPKSKNKGNGGKNRKKTKINRPVRV